MVVERRKNKGRARGKEREIERVEVLERWFQMKEKIRTDERMMWESCAAKRGDGGVNDVGEGGTHICGEHKKKHVVCEQGNNKHIDNNNSLSKWQRSDEGAVLV